MVEDWSKRGDEAGKAGLLPKMIFAPYEETAYLMQSINNAVRINSEIEALRAGKGVEKRAGYMVKLVFAEEPGLIICIGKKPISHGIYLGKDPPV